MTPLMIRFAYVPFLLLAILSPLTLKCRFWGSTFLLIIILERGWLFAEESWEGNRKVHGGQPAALIQASLKALPPTSLHALPQDMAATISQDFAG